VATAEDVLDYAVYTSPSDFGSASPTLLTSGTLQSDGSDDNNRRRAVIDVNGEAEDLWLELSSTSLAAARYAELLDVWVVYDQAQQSRGY
jgi:hypothetical protein